MKYGFIIPGGDLHRIIQLGKDAEAAGWDGVFYWDAIYIASVGLMYDPWIVLAAIAMQTRRVRIGAMLTALARRRPWKVARETVTLDHLSKGRLILPVGLGALDDGGFTKVGESLDRKIRAERLDESLEILTGLWSGKPFTYKGKHYHLGRMTFRPPPLQSPRIPIWVVGAWPRIKSMQRVLRYDGLIPTKMKPDGSFTKVLPEDIRAMREYVDENRTQQTHFDIIKEGETPVEKPQRASKVVQPYAEAGVSWWLESRWSAKGDDVRKRIVAGPPRID